MPALALKPFPLNINRAARQYDPTHTIFLRNTFSRKMRVRFSKLKQAIRKAIIDEDCLALQPAIRRVLVMETALKAPGHRAFDFPLSGDKVDGFMKWLKSQEELGLLELIEMPRIGQSSGEPWTNLYVKDSYERGLQRARYELARAGYAVPSIEATGGVMASMSLPFHVDRISLLYRRTYNDLKGISDAMDSQISRILSQAMADGKGAREIARLLTRTISGPGGDLAITDVLGRFIPAEQRALMLARTEIIRSFAESSLAEYKTWGAEGVNVLAEFVNAGYNVCPICLDLTIKYKDGISIDQASGIIPAHPNCRCAWIPKDVTDQRRPVYQ